MSNPAESIPLNYAEELREIRAGVDVLVASNLDILELALAQTSMRGPLEGSLPGKSWR